MTPAKFLEAAEEVVINGALAAVWAVCTYKLLKYVKENWSGIKDEIMGDLLSDTREDNTSSSASNKKPSRDFESPERGQSKGRPFLVEKDGPKVSQPCAPR